MIVFIIALILLVMFVVFISCVMLFYFERLNGESYSVVVVPGARIRADMPSKMLKRRLDKAVLLLENNINAVCIVSGGQGSDEDYTEASVMKKYIESRKIDADRIYIEDKSRNTKENFLFTSDVIIENNLSKEIVITTDHFHSFRCSHFAKRAGLNARVCPTKTPIKSLVFHWFREILAIIKAHIVN